MSRRANGDIARDHSWRGPAASPCIGDWVVASSSEFAGKRRLGLVIGINDDKLVLQDGSVWPSWDVHPFDVAGILEIGAALVSDLMLLRHVDEDDVLRVHRAACLAREYRAPRVDADAQAMLTAIIATDQAIADLERAKFHAIRVRLPNLASSLYLAGALALAALGHEAPHPRWPDIPARKTP